MKKSTRPKSDLESYIDRQKRTEPAFADFDRDYEAFRNAAENSGARIKKRSKKPMTCDCGGRYQEANRDFDGIACAAMVCASCGDIVFTVEQSKRYHALRLERMVEQVTPENRHEEVPTSPSRPARKYHKWSDLRAQMFTPEEIEEQNREVAKEIRRMNRCEIKRRLDMPYTLEFIRNSDGSFFVKVKEFKGCMGEGATLDEAYTMIRDAMAGWMKAKLEERQPIPEPQSKGRSEYETDLILANPELMADLEAARAETEFLDIEEVFGPEKKKKAPSKTRLLKAIRKFHDDSLNGEYYAPFNINSKNFKDVPKKTEVWFDKLSDFLREAAALADGGDHAPAVEAFRLLYDLIDRMERGKAIVFAEELGGWMIHADEKAALRSFLCALAATTGPAEFTDIVIPLLERDETDCLASKVYRSALKFATADQKKALKIAVEDKKIKVK